MTHTSPTRRVGHSLSQEVGPFTPNETRNCLCLPDQHRMEQPFTHRDRLNNKLQPPGLLCLSKTHTFRVVVLKKFLPPGLLCLSYLPLPLKNSYLPGCCASCPGRPIANPVRARPSCPDNTEWSPWASRPFVRPRSRPRQGRGVVFSDRVRVPGIESDVEQQRKRTTWGRAPRRRTMRPRRGRRRTTMLQRLEGWRGRGACRARRRGRVAVP